MSEREMFAMLAGSGIFSGAVTGILCRIKNRPVADAVTPSAVLACGLPVLVWLGFGAVEAIKEVLGVLGSILLVLPGIAIYTLLFAGLPAMVSAGVAFWWIGRSRRPKPPRHPGQGDIR